MRLKLLTVWSCVVLTGCGVLSEGEPLIWRPYKDLDGSTQYMTFTEVYRVADKTNRHNIAYRAKTFGDIKARETLGTMYPLRSGGAEDGKMVAIFLLENNSLNPHSVEDIALLQKAKTFDFYEFGNMRLGHVRYQAKNSICADFKSKVGVDLHIATNYYPDNSFTDYVTTTIKVKLNHKEVLDKIGYSANFSGDNAHLQKAMREQEKEHGRAVAVRNLSEKASVLANIVCNAD